MKKRDEFRNRNDLPPENGLLLGVRLPSLPIKVPLPQAPGTFGISRSAIYRAARRGDIALSKLGRSTLVDTRSVLTYLASLPAA